MTTTRTQNLVSIEAFAEILKGKRKRAIDGRAASGIEKVWAEDEDHYEGIDAVNRNESGFTKPRSAEGTPPPSKAKTKNRSTVFLKITRPYCDAASARVADMLLPTDDRNWALRPTPVPDLIRKTKDMTPVTGADGQPVMQPVEQPQPPQGVMSRMAGAVKGAFTGQQQPQAPQQKPVTVADLAKKAIDQAKEASEAAQNQIDDWLVECRYHAEVRKVIDSTTQTGTGILKGPIPVKSTRRAAVRGEDGTFALEIKTETLPASVFVPNWNFYPDPNCGNDIQRGAYTWEKDDITARGLRDLKGTLDSEGNPVYIDQMIDMCLTEGPSPAVDGRKQKDNQTVNDDDLFEIWYFYGQVSRENMEAAGCACGAKDQYPCMVTMVNDRVIKISLSVMDSGEFPYDVMVWQSRQDHWAGIGVSRQMRECQKGANAAVRNLMDNAGLSAGPQIIVDTSKIEPADGKMEIVPRKLWRKKKGGSDMVDVRDAFVIVTIETRQAELMNIIEFWLKEAEDCTGMPMLLQGQQGKAPDTYGGQQLAVNNASGVLRRIARIHDDRVTEPHIGRYYEWLLLYGPEECKGDFTIDARGSSALVERDMQNQAMMQMLGVSLNPAYGIDPELTVKEVLKGMRVDPKRVEYTEEKKAEMAKRPPPEDPRVTAANILAQSRIKLEEMDDKDNADHAAAQAQLQMAQQRFDAAEAQKDRQLAVAVEKANAEIERMKMNGASAQTIQQLKVKLSDTVMKLQQQERLSRLSMKQANDHKVADHMMTARNQPNPPTEPVGRAASGASFTQ